MRIKLKNLAVVEENLKSPRLCLLETGQGSFKTSKANTDRRLKIPISSKNSDSKLSYSGRKRKVSNSNSDKKQVSRASKVRLLDTIVNSCSELKSTQFRKKIKESINIGKQLSTEMHDLCSNIIEVSKTTQSQDQFKRLLQYQTASKHIDLLIKSESIERAKKELNSLTKKCIQCRQSLVRKSRFSLLKNKNSIILH